MSDDVMHTDRKMEEENFAELLESYQVDLKAEFRVGDRVSGRIIGIGKDTVFVDTGGKMDGVVEKIELLDEAGELPYKEGDLLELYVVSTHDNEIRLSRALSGAGGEDLLRDAYENVIPVEGKVIATCKGGFHVEVMKRRAFCPWSQMDSVSVQNGEDYIGKEFQFLITTLEEKGKNIVLSRRILLEQETQKVRDAFYEKATPGTIVQGSVTKLMPYGIFVQLVPGVEGMVHVSEMSWSRVETPQQLVQPGESVSVKIIDIEHGDKRGKSKIALSMKQVGENPWNSVEEVFNEGDKVTGKVTRCADFGAFVEIAPGVEGLVHISEMSYTKRILKPEEIVNPGDSVSVWIKEIDTQKRRISLSLRDAEGDPWLQVQQKYRVGQPLQGTIQSIRPFGYFVTLEPGVVALLPKSKIDRSPDPASLKKLKEGDAIPVMIEAINPADRRITLASCDPGEAQNWEKFVTTTASGPMGSLGEKLRRAFDPEADK
jgi:small subunit ribosomal protein S1